MASLQERLAHADKSVTASLILCATPQSRYGHLRPLMKVLEVSGHGLLWILPCVLLIHYSDTRHIYANFLVALLLDLAVIGTLKFAFQRSRPLPPTDMVGHYFKVDDYSFPSGHATRAVMVTALICEFFLASLWSSALWCSWAAVVSVSRILLGRHHVLDVFAGILVGYVEFLVAANCLWFSAALWDSILWSI